MLLHHIAIHTPKDMVQLHLGPIPMPKDFTLSHLGPMPMPKEKGRRLTGMPHMLKAMEQFHMDLIPTQKVKTPSLPVTIPCPWGWTQWLAVRILSPKAEAQ